MTPKHVGAWLGLAHVVVRGPCSGGKVVVWMSVSVKLTGIYESLFQMATNFKLLLQEFKLATNFKLLLPVQTGDRFQIVFARVQIDTNDKK